MRVIRLTAFLAFSFLTMTASVWAETLTVFGAGTLAVPFKEIDAAFEKQHPGVSIQSQFMGNVRIAKQVTELGQPVDVVAVADYSGIPQYLFGAQGRSRYTDWYVGFARNAMTFVYTPKSKYSAQINAGNWYNYLTQPGVEIGRSNPDTDPSGYIALQMLALANTYYHNPTIQAKVLANAPLANVRDIETSLIAPLELGQIDYLMTYRSDAIQHGFRFLDLPVQINLSDPNYAAMYAKAVAHTRNGDVAGKPIVYAVTILNDSKHKALAEQYVRFLLGPQGQAVMRKSGFGVFAQPIAANVGAMPVELRPLVQPWPVAAK